MIIYTAWSVVFKKSLIVKTGKQDFPVCLSISRLHLFHSELQSFEHWSGAVGRRENSSQLMFGCPVFQHSVCIWNANTALCGCLVERQGNTEKWVRRMVVRADCSGNEGMAGRTTRSVGGVWVDTARRTGRGGDRGGVGGVLPAVSLQIDESVHLLELECTNMVDFIVNKVEESESDIW